MLGVWVVGSRDLSIFGEVLGFWFEAWGARARVRGLGSRVEGSQGVGVHGWGWE